MATPFSGIIFPELQQLDSQTAADAVAAPTTRAGLLARMRTDAVAVPVPTASPFELKTTGVNWMPVKVEMPVQILSAQTSGARRRERLF